VQKRQDAYAVHMVKGEAAPEPGLAPRVTAQAGPQATVLVVSRDRMGGGEEELGTILMRSSFYTLTEIEPLPKAIIFFNAAERRSRGVAVEAGWPREVGQKLGGRHRPGRG